MESSFIKKLRTIHGNRFTEDFIFEMDSLQGVCGVYFLYDAKDELLYVGKSVNLSERVVGSSIYKSAVYVEYAKTATKSDASIYEKYYIAKLKPLLNKEGKHDDEATVDLPDIRTYETVNVFQEVNEMEVS